MLDVDIPGKRRRGRPNLRWKDACKRDMTQAGLKEDNATNRAIWRKKLISYTGDPGWRDKPGMKKKKKMAHIGPNKRRLVETRREIYVAKPLGVYSLHLNVLTRNFSTFASISLIVLSTGRTFSDVTITVNITLKAIISLDLVEMGC